MSKIEKICSNFAQNFLTYTKVYTEIYQSYNCDTKMFIYKLAICTVYLNVNCALFGIINLNVDWNQPIKLRK